MTSNNLPPELAAIVERAMEEFGKYYTVVHAISPDFKSAKDMMQDILTSAVQEAAQWGREDEQERHKGACKPDRIQDALEKWRP